jgi:hypothetical protein
MHSLPSNPRQSLLLQPQPLKPHLTKQTRRTTKSLSKVPIKRTTKSLLTQLRSDLEDSDYGDYDEVDIYVGYRRPELIKNKNIDDEELSDYVKTRLLLARYLALKKYHEIWG